MPRRRLGEKNGPPGENAGRAVVLMDGRPYIVLRLGVFLPSFWAVQSRMRAKSE